MARMTSSTDRKWAPWDTGDGKPCEIEVLKITPEKALECRLAEHCEKASMNARSGLVTWVTNDPKENAARKRMAGWALNDSRGGLIVDVNTPAIAEALCRAGVQVSLGDRDVCVDGKLKMAGLEEKQQPAFAICQAADMSVVNDILAISDSLNLKSKKEEEGKD